MGLVCPFTYYSSNRTSVCMVSLPCISRPFVAYLNLSRFTGEVLCLENLLIKQQRNMGC